jgi:hypothetical protein
MMRGVALARRRPFARLEIEAASTGFGKPGRKRICFKSTILLFSRNGSGEFSCGDVLRSTYVDLERICVMSLFTGV